MSKSNTIVIIGLGFVGLTFAVFLTLKKFNVIGIDNNQNKLEQFKKGQTSFFEPDLDKSLKKALKKSLAFSNSINNIDSADMVFVTVGTPSKSDGSIDLGYIQTVSEELSTWLKKSKNYPVVSYKSTIVPGTTENFVKPILESSGKIAGNDFGLVVNPEFLREGSALHDTINPHVIVIGGDEKSLSKLQKFYAKIYLKKIPIKTTNRTTAEFIKYANNAFLATKISFINTIANICQRLSDTNVDDIAETIGIDPRIGSSFLKAGPGYGGSCFPKDVQALISLSNSLGIESLLLNATHMTNVQQADKVVKLIEENIPNISGKIVSLLGLSFKENSDDIRQSVSISLIEKLLARNVRVKVHDPKAIDNTRIIFGDKITYCKTTNECIKDSECAVLLTSWDEYTKLSNESFSLMKTPFLIDTRRLLTKKNLSIKYVGLGVGK